MDILQITKEKAVKAYSKSDLTVKALLEDLFGKETFNINFGEQIKTFEDGLAFRGISSGAVLPSVPSFMMEHEKRIHAFAKLVFLGDIYRNGWVPDYSDSSQLKWYPWEIYKSGSGLSLYVVDYDYSHADVASRLTFPTEEMVKVFEKNFRAIYNDYML